MDTEETERVDEVDLSLKVDPALARAVNVAADRYWCRPREYIVRALVERLQFDKISKGTSA
jgi:hypothetical protein